MNFKKSFLIFIKYLKIFKENVNLVKKVGLEYKANLYSVVLFDLGVFLTYMCYFLVLGFFSFEFLNWSMFDFVVYFLLLLVAGKGMWIFSLMNFNFFLIKGGLNLYLVRPVNPFFLSLLRSLNSGTLLTFPFTLIFLIILIFLGNYQNYFLGFLFLCFSIIYYQFFVNFIQSLAFFMKKNEFLFDGFREISFLNEKYTPKIFEKNSFLHFCYFLPTSLFGFFNLELFKGRVALLKIYFPYFILTLFFLIFSVYFLWKIGLKKYEGYN